MRVLVVEDIEINRIVLQMVLEQLECIVKSADNGVIGVEKFEQESFDLILMDLHMPECDGFEATRKIREIEALKNLPQLPIYAVSANTSEQARTRCSEVGMTGFLAKPVTFASVREILLSACSARSEVLS
jgi:CheY-like chemotaxis protein